MSQDAAATLSIPVLQPTARRRASSRELHPQLRQQLEQARARVGNAGEVVALLELVSEYYERLDEERRGVVRSMQLLAEESRSFGSALAGGDAGHLQAILDHIKDVVITLDAEGSIKIFNPTGERVFGYSRAELIGQSIERLLPELPLFGSVERGLAALTARADSARADLRPHAMQARHKGGGTFPAELIASRVRIDRRDVYVLCLRDTSERVRAEQALRDSEARYRALVDSAPELIVVFDHATGRCVDANENALRFFGIAREQLHDLQPFQMPPSPVGVRTDLDVQDLTHFVERALLGEPQVFDWQQRRADGQTVSTEVRLMGLTGQAGLLRASITDVSVRRRAEALTAGERNVFERMAADAPLSEILQAVVELVESVGEQFIVGISRLAPGRRRFSEVIGERLDPAWRALELDMPIDLGHGASAAAVRLGRTVISHDIETDALWQHCRAAAMAAGSRAAWAVPIQAANGRTLGALTVYRPHCGLPEGPDVDLIRHAAQLAGIAIDRWRGAEALRASESKFRNLYEQVLEGVYQCAPDGKLREVNPAFVKMLGYASVTDIYQLPGIAVLYADAARRTQFELALQAEGEIHNMEHELRCSDGSSLFVMESARAVRDADGRVVAYEGVMANITARKRAEQAMFAEKERAQVTLQSIGDAVIATDREGRIDYMNPVAEQLCGWRSAEAHGQLLSAVLRLRDEVTREELENPLVRCLREGQQVNFSDHSVLENRRGQEIAIQDSAAPIRDRSGEIVGAVVVFRDVTKERRLQRALSYQANHDALTGLINRREFDLRLSAALDEAQAGHGPHALLYVDLDQFKLVNDTCGHSAGDRLLRDITGLLVTHVRATDTIARLGGDEFGILMRKCGLEQARRTAEALRQSIRDFRFVWDEAVSSVGASIGVVEITADSGSVANLLSAADIACYCAKDEGRNRVHVYDAGDVNGRHREMHWVTRVTRALEENQLELHCQPIVPVDPADRAAPEFHELLVRLRGDDGELIMPGEFIPAAERYNIIPSIDRWVIGQAADMLRAHSADAGRPLLLAVNLSGMSLSDRAFLDFVVAQLEDARVAQGLCFEITETAAITSLTQAAFFMRELKKRGCRFALDDFGSGLSSFHYLKQLPVDFLKIDGQFTGSVATDVVDRSVVEAISQVGRALGIATIAEKVESASVFDQLRHLRVQYAQGHFLGQPVPLAHLRTKLESGRPPAPTETSRLASLREPPTQ